jgi:hypothetical protein
MSESVEGEVAEITLCNTRMHAYKVDELIEEKLRFRNTYVT